MGHKARKHARERAHAHNPTPVPQTTTCRTHTLPACRTSPPQIQGVLDELMSYDGPLGDHPDVGGDGHSITRGWRTAGGWKGEAGGGGGGGGGGGN